MFKNQSIKTHRKRTACYSLIATAVLFVFSLVFVPNALPNQSFAEELTVTPSLTISPSNTLAFSVQPGQFNSGSQTLTVKTSNYTGYTLTIAPTSGTSTALSNVNVSGATLPTITLPSGSSSITSSGFTSAGYGFSIDGTNYKPVNNGSIIKSTGNGSAGTDNITFTIGAKAESTTPAGSYQKQFTLTATANAAVYAITYNANAGTDTVTNMPASPQTSGSVSGTNLTLASETPVRTGYTFLGWSTNSSATTATYAAGGTYNLDQTTANQVALYAVWEAKTYTITIKTVTGISKVTLNGTECTSTSGCSVSGLKYNTAYNLVATPATGYSFSSWNAGSYGSIASTSSASTTYTVGAGASTITPSATANKYTCTKQYRLQNADGTYPSSYTAAGTEQVNYGTTCTYTPSAITDYTTPSSTSGTMTENGLTLSVDYPRTTYTLTINRNTTYISSVTGSGTKRWGEVVSISATPASSGLFNGWSQTAGTTGSFASTSNASTTFTMPKSNATIYADGKTAIVTFDQAYANAGKTKQNGYYKMQDMTTAICNAVTTGQTGTLIDTRDNQTYRVAKWKMSADGSSAACWMKDNLNLGAVSFASGVTQLNSSNSNMPTASAISASTFNSWNSRSVSDYYTNAVYVPVSGQDSYGNKYGTLYNYAAASANTINAASGNNNSNASNSLCPSGWRLPTGGSSGEFKAFYDANSPTDTTIQSDYGFSPAGVFYDGGAPRDQGSNGNYWSSTMLSKDGDHMNDLFYYPSFVQPAGSNFRTAGESVRCIKE